MLDTTSDTELSFCSTPEIVGSDSRGDDLEQIGIHNRTAAPQIRWKRDLFPAEKGPNAEYLAALLVARLCGKWERETGLRVTVNPYKKTDYDGAPQSEAGKFVARRRRASPRAAEA